MTYDRIHTTVSRGFCYVEYEKAEDAEKACKFMNGAQIDGQEVNASVALAPPKPRYLSRASPPRRARFPRRSPDRRRRSPMRRRSPPRQERERDREKRSPRRSRSRSPRTRRNRRGSVSSGSSR